MKIPKWCNYLKPINVVSTVLTAAIFIFSVWSEIFDEIFLTKVLITYGIILVGSFIIYKIYVPSEKHLDFYDKDNKE